MKHIDIEVVDNFLSPQYFNKIKNVITSHTQPWHFNNNISTNNQSDNMKSYGFYYDIIKEKDILTEAAVSYMLFGLIYQAQNYCNRDNILNCHIDMVTHSTTKKYHHEPHVDFIPYKPNLISAIFYVTDSDAETTIFNKKQTVLDGNKSQWSDLKLTVKKKILPKENRIVFFNGHYIHTGSSPMNYKRRILINMNYN